MKATKDICEIIKKGVLDLLPVILFFGRNFPG